MVGLLESSRLLTLTGPGGTGKTRLAAQAAGKASDGYPDGVWWVPLAALREPELVLETGAQVVGSKNGLAEYIADKSLLLLFDNFEQVVEAAGDVAGLLAVCPNVDLLVTSREPLHVTGEQEYPVPPLVHEEGVGFFLARARAVEPRFQADEAVSEICRRLDDLPLALELAAARVKALSSTQILERLEQRLPLLTGGARDLPERQRTLRAAIEWSYDLLVGDRDWIGRLDNELDNVRAALEFATMADTQWALRTAAALEDYWAMRGQVLEARARLEGALAVDTQPTASRCRALIAAANAAIIAGDRKAADAHADEALALSGELGDAHLVALSRYMRAWIMMDDEEWAAAREILEEILPVFREVGDSDSLLRGTRSLAWMCEALGDVERYRALTEENLERARAFGHRRIEARSLGALGAWALEDGRLEDARTLLSESCLIDEELGNLIFLMVDLVRMAWLSEREGSLEVAAQLLSHAAKMREELGYSLECWMVEEYDQTLTAVQQQLDGATLDEAWEAGRRMPLERALALALDFEPSSE